VALELAGVTADQVAVHLVKDGGEQHKEEFRAINPMEQVPALYIDGLLLTQSVAIMEYLAERFPTSGLLPEDIAERARVRQVTEMICSGIQPLQNLSVLQRVSSEPGERAEWARAMIVPGFSALESLLATCAGTCCVGDSVTMADCCLVPQVYNANRFSVDLSKYPIIARLEKSLSARPEFVAAHPSKQPDCPPDLQ